MSTSAVLADEEIASIHPICSFRRTAAPFEPPTEIMQMILDAVQGSSPSQFTSDAIPTWKACSLVSARWRDISQAYLLRGVEITDLLEACQFFETAHWVAVHVRSLRVRCVIIGIEELDRLLGSLPQLRVLDVRHTDILCHYASTQRDHCSRRHHLEALECASFGLARGRPNLSGLCGLLSIFLEIRKIRMTGINHEPGSTRNIEHDTIVAAARQLVAPRVQSLVLQGLIEADFGIPIVLFLHGIGAMRSLQELVMDVRTNFSLIKFSEVLCAIGPTLQRLSIMLNTSLIDMDPGNAFLPLYWKEGLTACPALTYFRLHLHFRFTHESLENVAVAPEQALNLYWNMAADVAALLPITRLRHLKLDFFYTDFSNKSEEEWCGVHSLSWSRMREVCSGFACLESIGMTISQPPRNSSRRRRLQDCVKYEMRGFQRMFIEDSVRRSTFTTTGCEDSRCKRYNASTQPEAYDMH